MACTATYFDRNTLEVRNYDDYYPYLAKYGLSDVQYEVSIRRRSVARQIQEIGELVAGRRLLDVGAGPGYFCAVAKECGWSAVAVEVSEPAINVGRRMLGVEYVELDSIDDGQLDVVACRHVVEHIEWPSEFLGLLVRKLCSGGILVIHVPHQEPLSFWLRNRLGSCLQLKRDTHCALYVPDHLTGFTRKSLGCLMNRVGCDPVFVKSRSMWSKYYDPFFLRGLLKNHRYGALMKQCVRHVIENVGVLVGRGDWIVGYFRKA
jgi:SAM-dependent methyltransferase